MAVTRSDPITLEIIQSSLQAVSNEMFSSMRKTAMSSIIYEVLDMGTCITDAEGNLAASGAGIPAFVATLDKAVKRIAVLNEANEIGPGDVFALPVFAGDTLVGWTANIAHWNDVGGMVPGSISNQATSLFQEGLRLPGIKVVEGGEPIRSVIEIMKANSRLPDFLEGDMWAGISGAGLGERRIAELVAKYGKDTFLAAVA